MSTYSIALGRRHTQVSHCWEVDQAEKGGVRIEEGVPGSNNVCSPHHSSGVVRDEPVVRNVCCLIHHSSRPVERRGGSRQLVLISQVSAI